jgi:Malectin domain
LCFICRSGPNNAPGKRLFEVSFENGAVKSGILDIFVLSGNQTNAAYVQEYTVTVADGFLDISFDAVVDNAQVCGIEIKV